MSRTKQCGGGAKYDEVGDQRGEKHADADVECRGTQFLLGSANIYRVGMRDGTALFDLKSRLPKEKIGRECSTDDRHHHGQISGMKLNIGTKSVMKNFPHLRVRQEGCRNVGKQSQS